MPRSGGLTSLVAGTVTMDRFLASRVARSEGELWEDGGGEDGVVREWVSFGDDSAGLLRSSSLNICFLEVMVID